MLAHATHKYLVITSIFIYIYGCAIHSGRGLDLVNILLFDITSEQLAGCKLYHLTLRVNNSQGENSITYSIKVYLILIVRFTTIGLKSGNSTEF